MRKTGGCVDIQDEGETLAAIARSLDCGKAECIVSSNALGIEWGDSTGKFWFMQWPSILDLLKGWNGAGMVCWFFDSTLSDGTSCRAIVRVYPEMMRCILDLAISDLDRKNTLRGLD
jgi:hypothetical protein